MAEDANDPNNSSAGRSTQRDIPVLAYLVPASAGMDDRPAVSIWSAINRHKLLIVLTTLVCSVVAGVIAFSITPVYRAEVLLSPVTEGPGRSDLHGLKSQLESIALLPNMSDNGDNLKAEAMATLQSRAFAMQFIKEEQLRPLLFDKYWNAKTGEWIQLPGESPPTDWDTYELFNTKVRKVSEDRKSGLITVAVEWKDRKLASLWANSLVERINAHMRQQAIDEAEKSVDYLNQELNKTNIVELQRAIYTLIEEQVQRIMMANVREQYAFKVIDPAVTSDADDFYKPKRVSLVGFGAVLGLILGICLAILRQIVKVNRTRSN